MSPRDILDWTKFIGMLLVLAGIGGGGWYYFKALPEELRDTNEKLAQCTQARADDAKSSRAAAARHRAEVDQINAANAETARAYRVSLNRLENGYANLLDKYDAAVSAGDGCYLSPGMRDVWNDASAGFVGGQISNRPGSDAAVPGDTADERR